MRLVLLVASAALLLPFAVNSSFVPYVVDARVSEDDDFSFRFRVHWDENSTWVTKHIWCLRCEHSGSNGCEEDGGLVVHRCNGQNRFERFIVDDDHHIMPEVSPELCLTRQEDDSIRLKPCQDGNPFQQWYGLDNAGAFELSQHDGYCLAREETNPGTGDEVVALDCQESRREGSGIWDLSNVEGVFPDEEEHECGSCFEVWEGNTSLGTMEPIVTQKDITDFYCYYCNNDPSFNAEDVISLVPDYSLAFVHQHEASCDLALVIVHDSKQDSTGGAVTMWISGNLEKSVVQDGRISPSDSFDYIPQDDETECSWVWAWQDGTRYRTDGIAHYWDPDERDCIYVDAEFHEGIDEWQFVPGPLPNSGQTDPDDYVTINKEKTLWVCRCGSEDEERKRG